MLENKKSRKNGENIFTEKVYIYIQVQNIMETIKNRERGGIEYIFF